MNERSEECGGKPSSNASGCSHGGDTPAVVSGRSHDIARIIAYLDSQIAVMQRGADKDAPERLQWMAARNVLRQVREFCIEAGDNAMRKTTQRPNG
jgi:hypothetical protein